MEAPADIGQKRDTRKIIQAAMIAFIIVGAGLIGYVLYQRSASADESSNVAAIKAGDKVTMNYIGRLPDGRVFDTSILSVAYNDALYQKSLTFTKRANNSYVPFNMTAGDYGSGGTIKGFALGVLGLHPGDESVIDVKPADGYAVNSAQLKSGQLVQTLTVLDHLTVEQFLATFGAEPVSLQIFRQPFWQWDVQVIDVLGDFVVVKELPYVGQIVYPFGNPNAESNPMGWPVLVEGYDPTANGGEGVITVRHELTAADAFEIKGTDIDGQTFILTDVDTDNGTFRIHRSDSQTGYNGELAGRELFFEVTIIKVQSA